MLAKRMYIQEFRRTTQRHPARLVSNSKPICPWNDWRGTAEQDPAAKRVITGSVIVFAVVLDSWRHRLAEAKSEE